MSIWIGILHHLLEINFLKKLPSRNATLKFKYPDKEDKDYVTRENIVRILSPPVFGGTKRTSHLLLLDDDLSAYL